MLGSLISPDCLSRALIKQPSAPLYTSLTDNSKAFFLFCFFSFQYSPPPRWAKSTNEKWFCLLLVCVLLSARRGHTGCCHLSAGCQQLMATQGPNNVHNVPAEASGRTLTHSSQHSVQICFIDGRDDQLTHPAFINSAPKRWKMWKVAGLFPCRDATGEENV